MNFKLLKTSFFWRTFSPLVILVVVLLVLLLQIVSYLANLHFSNLEYEKAQLRLDIITAGFSSGRSVQSSVDLQAIIDQGNLPDVNTLAFLDGTGLVFSSPGFPSSLLADLDSSIPAETAEDQFWYQANDETFRVFTSTVPTGLLALSVAKPETGFIPEMFKLDVVLSFFITGILVVLMLAFFFLRQSTRLESISNEAEIISRGDFNKRIPDSYPSLSRLVSVINNLAKSSARQVTELTTDRNRLKTIFAGMVEGVIDVDLEQRIVHINQAAARLLKVDSQASLNKPLWQELRNQEIISALETAINKNSVIKSQMTLSRNGAEQVVDIYAASLSDSKGVQIGAVIVLHDITDIKVLERVRTDFVANASHELKTPITAIRGLSETMLEDQDADEDTLRHFMQRIHSQSLRLSQLVSDLMTLSRLESEHTDITLSRLHFSELVKRSVKSAINHAEQKHISLILNVPDQELYVKGESQSLSQLVDNLIDNAIKYTEQGGKVEVSVNNENGYSVLRVTDSGIGISPQNMNRIFERFYRVDKARSQSLGGTGLGLSIVKNIADRHGGQVSVASRIGRGSTFTLRLALVDSLQENDT